MNIDKMRHQMERIQAATVGRGSRTWLNLLTPEHRRLHEPPFPLQGWPCGECIKESGRQMGVSLAHMMEAMTREKRAG